MSKKVWFKDKLQRLSDIAERGADKSIRIAVTGLSGAGKTAFISSFVNQVISSNQSKQLPFWLAHNENRILGSKISRYEQLHIPEFPYQAAMKSLTAMEPSWPESTRSITQVRLGLKYKIKNSLLRKLQSYSHLNIELVDYPGEWLLDLPMLHMSFQQWSVNYQEWLKQGPQKKLSRQWQHMLIEQGFEPNAQYDAQKVKLVATLFREFLLSCKSHDETISFIQPGRFILPGELQDAPVLDFFPIIGNLDCFTDVNDGTNLTVLEQRYNYYRDNVVKPFFKEYFSKVDRQILLVDSLMPLNNGMDAYLDLQNTISQLITSFNYGQSNWFRRMFQPSIDKLIIAATKSDHVPPDQHPQLATFISNMLANAQNQVKYQEVEVETLILSSIKVTEPVKTQHQGKDLLCVKGLEIGTRKPIVNYPGKIPTKAMTSQQWKDANFNFVEFDVPELVADQPLPHFRMDQAIQKLIGDKFL